MERVVPALFEGREAASAVYSALLGLLPKDGAFRVEEKKTSLHIISGRAAFLGVHPRKDGLRLNIVLSRPLLSTRVVRSEQVSKSRWHNEVDVRSVDELDAELLEWLAEAQKLQEA